jgi:hypothetical protein
MPAGPLWDVISQKIVGGSLQQGGELVLEIAEARLRNVNIKGSLRVSSKPTMLQTLALILQMSADQPEHISAPMPSPCSPHQ